MQVEDCKMTKLKLEVGKKYIVELNPINGNQFLHSNYNDCVLEFVRRFNKGVLLFDNNVRPLNLRV